ncbi:MAG TPA: hypothetical protein VMQ44_03375 [Candidatus Saccharimonadales bacterium]|nr:hypothetical protein [Candidatus Saccharimonadales bacterium]
MSSIDVKIRLITRKELRMSTLAERIFRLAGPKWYAKESGRLAMNCLAFIIKSESYNFCFIWSHGVMARRGSGLEDEVAGLLAESLEGESLPDPNPEFVLGLTEVFHIEDDPEHKLINAHLILLAADCFFTNRCQGEKKLEPSEKVGPYIEAFTAVMRVQNESTIAEFLSRVCDDLRSLAARLELV